MACPTWSDIYSFISSIALPVTTKVLAGLGIGYLTFTGVNAALDAYLSGLLTVFAAMPPRMAAFFHTAGIDTAISFAISAISFRLTWLGMQSNGSITRWIVKQ